MKKVQNQSSNKFGEEFKELVRKRELLYSNRRDETEEPHGGSKKHLVFSCDNMNIAVKLGSVETLYNFGKLNPLPIVPRYILGLFNHRGQVVPVIDLYYLIKGEQSVHAYILVFRDSNNLMISFAVSDLIELIQIKDAEIRNVGVNVNDNIRRFISGELADGTFILNTDLGGIL